MGGRVERGEGRSRREKEEERREKKESLSLLSPFKLRS
jgi:hypothetical protein